MCKKAFFQMLRRFFVFFGYIISIISFPCLSSLIFTFVSFSLLLSSLLFSSLPLLFSPLSSVVSVVSLFCAVVVFCLFCVVVVFSVFVLSLVAAAGAALLRCCRWLLRGCRCRCWLLRGCRCRCRWVAVVSRFGAVCFFDLSVHSRCHSGHC